MSIRMRSYSKVSGCLGRTGIQRLNNPIMGMLKVAQINLRHSKLATDNLRVILREEDIDICLIQEPWVRQSSIKGLRDRSFNLFYSQHEGKPRACILVRRTINAFLSSNFSSPDVAVVRVEPAAGGRCFHLVSAYMAHDRTAPPEEVRLLAEKVTSGEAILFGCDANARHTIWGSSEINARGESLFDFIISHNFTICNRGNDPTFVFPGSGTSNGWEEVLDITLSTHAFGVENWRVSRRNSFSDHRLILFEIGSIRESPTPRRNPRRTDWDLFKRVFDRKSNKLGSVISSIGELDKHVEVLEKSYQVAFAASCPVVFHKKTYPPWWSRDLSVLRKRLREVFNACFLCRDFQAYRECLKEYKKAVKDAKRDSWRKYCESIESVRDSARLGKILSGEHSCRTLVKRADGEWAESAMESLNILVDAHFPDNSGEPGDLIARELRVGGHLDFQASFLSSDRIAWAINGFSPFKSPGLDGIWPVMLQKTQGSVIPILQRIFSACLYLSYVPVSWRRAKVVFIPKVGRRGHSSAKDFRPISLTSFVLKVLERVIDGHLRERLGALLSTAQHAYVGGRSTETALHEVVGAVERSLERKQYTLAAFIDIEGAFNNLTAVSVINALRNLGAESCICLWVASLLGCREISAQMLGASVTRFVSRGTPQGGVLSPLLWLVVVNEMLSELRGSGVGVVAYADDIVLMVSGLFPSVISEVLEGALAKLGNWAAGCGLGVNPDKTKLMLFTRRYKPPPFRLPRLNNRSLQLSCRVRYLGVILDSKLHWGLHVEERVRKACVAFYSCKSMFGRKWGLGPRVVLWLYKQVVLPVLTYGCLVWWVALHRKCIITKLERLQRTACVGITGACRSCPSSALNVILHLLPIDLHVLSISAQGAIRLRDLGLWGRSLSGHSSILSRLPPNLREVRTDLAMRRLDFDGQVRAVFPDRERWRCGNVDSVSGITVFTDGSKMESGVGAGVYSESANFAESFRLPDTCSVFQAEVFAIWQAARMLREMGSRGDVRVFSDSQAAIKALVSPVSNSSVVLRCKEELKLLSGACTIRLFWVPGHSDIGGNERADELARRASAGEDSVTSFPDIHSPMAVVRREIFHFFKAEAQGRWSSGHSCVVSRALWPLYDFGKTWKILGTPRHSLSRLIAVYTGHWMIGTHAEKMGLPFNSRCRSCGIASERETIFHFLCSCPGLAARRLKFLGVPFFDGLAQCAGLDPFSLLRFIDSSGWL